MRGECLLEFIDLGRTGLRTIVAKETLATQYIEDGRLFLSPDEIPARIHRWVRASPGGVAAIDREPFSLDSLYRHCHGNLLLTQSTE